MKVDVIQYFEIPLILTIKTVADFAKLNDILGNGLRPVVLSFSKESVSVSYCN